MLAFETAMLIAEHASATQATYREFIRTDDLSVGLYTLPAGSSDPQQPHTEDEVYYVAAGRGMIRVADDDRAVQAGSVVFVAAGVEHRFHSISEDLQVLVFFGPAEYARRAAAALKDEV